jgi:hypothetical protein
MSAPHNNSATCSSYVPTTAGGATGQILTTNSTHTHIINSAVNTEWTTPNEAELKTIDRRLEEIEKRLHILTKPNQELLDKYPALKEAYDHYKLIEKLIGEEQ